MSAAWCSSLPTRRTAAPLAGPSSISSGRANGSGGGGGRRLRRAAVPPRSRLASRRGAEAHPRRACRTVGGVEKLPHDDGPSQLVRFFGEGLRSRRSHTWLERARRPSSCSPSRSSMPSTRRCCRPASTRHRLLRNPRHALAAAGERPTPPHCPAKQSMLVGRAVEVLWPLEESYKGVVQQHDEKTGCHFIVHADARRVARYIPDTLPGSCSQALRRQGYAGDLALPQSRLRKRPSRPAARDDQRRRPPLGPPRVCPRPAPPTRPGGLPCHRCARSIHASCMRDASEGSIAEAVRASSEGVGRASSASCAMLQRTTPAELRGHRPARLPELQGPWRRRGPPSAASVRWRGQDGGRCARVCAGRASRVLSTAPSAPLVDAAAPANGGATTAAAGKPMRPSLFKPDRRPWHGSDSTPTPTLTKLTLAVTLAAALIQAS